MAEVRFDQIGGVSRAALIGRLDSAGVDSIETVFLAGIAAAGLPAIVDMSSASYLASRGVRMILAAARSLEDHGAQLVLYGALQAVRDVIDTSMIEAVLPVVDTEADALAALRQG